MSMEFLGDGADRENHGHFLGDSVEAGDTDYAAEIAADAITSDVGIEGCDGETRRVFERYLGSAMEVAARITADAPSPAPPDFALVTAAINDLSNANFDPTDGTIDYASPSLGFELPDSTPLLSFQQVFDSTQEPPPVSEQEIVSAMFDGEIDEHLTVVFDRARVTDLGVSDSVTTEYEGKLVRVTVSVTTLDEGQTFIKGIAVEEAVPLDRRGKSHFYSLYRDGIVRRNDSVIPTLDDARREIRSRPPATESFSHADGQPIAPTDQQFLADAVRRSADDQTVQESLGFNNQPVSLEEIAAVYKLMRQTRPGTA